MTQDEIIEMAKSINEDWWLDDIDLQDFARLVAEKERERMTVVAMDAAEKAVDVAIKLEREACATMSDWILKEGGGTWGDAIRKRK
jgi:hypothetical protein